MPAASELAFARIRITGKDRSKFLHNFCTNNIKALAVGVAVEAFFTDVKARILSHGYVLAFESSHEIWMLPGDSASLAKHLSRYVITEDVTVIDLTPENHVMVLRESSELLTLPPFETLAANNEGTSGGELNDSITASATLKFLRFSWASERLIAVAGSGEQISALRLKVSTGAEVTASQLELLRINERFPVIGRDMTNENLAPEAERNSIAISYTKGCYLGQEPIARLDAMGHVNRALRVIEFTGACSSQDVIGCSILTAEKTIAGTLTSAVQAGDRTIVGLAMVKVSSTSQPVFCELASGEKLSGHCRAM
jgi:folate-binding protein YgfZ